jgi:hypothetical protein
MPAYRGKYYKDAFKPPFDQERGLLFKIGDGSVKHENWYFRYRKQDGKYFQRSLRTSSKDKALELARNFWRQILDAEDAGVNYGDLNISTMYKKWRATVVFSSHRDGAISHKFEKYILPFFDNTPIKDIDNPMWLNFVRWRVNYYSELSDFEIRRKGAVRTPSVKTINGYRQTLLQLLRWCKMNNYLAVLPELTQNYKGAQISNINYSKTRGKALSMSQYQKIIKRLYQWAWFDRIALARKRDTDVWGVSRQDAEAYFLSEFDTIAKGYADRGYGGLPRDWINSLARKRIYYFVIISFNTLLRPSTEMTSLKWRDIRFVKSDRDPDLRIPIITTPKGKMGPRTVIGAYETYIHLLRWRGISKEYGFGGENQYVFPRWDGEDREMRASEMGRTFSMALRRWGLDQHTTGEKITLYSIRNTAISHRIRDSKWDLLRVSKQAGTSLLQISQAYADDIMMSNADKYAQAFLPEGSDTGVDKEKLQRALEFLEQFD